MVGGRTTQTLWPTPQWRARGHPHPQHSTDLGVFLGNGQLMTTQEVPECRGQDYCLQTSDGRMASHLESGSGINRTFHHLLTIPILILSPGESIPSARELR